MQASRKGLVFDHDTKVFDEDKFKEEDNDNSSIYSPPPLPPPHSSTAMTPEFLKLLDPLKSIWLFIIQPKMDAYGMTLADYLYASTTHEISSDKRNMLLKGHFKRKLPHPRSHKHSSALASASRKISIANLKKKKVATVHLENNSLANEAIICCPPKTPKCRVIKYGGKYEHPTYSITLPDSDENEALFSVENAPSNSNSSSSSSSNLEYNIFKSNSNSKLVGRVCSKSGLNFMLHISEGVCPMDKAILLGFVIAMDMLKLGKSRRKCNEYEEFND